MAYEIFISNYAKTKTLQLPVLPKEMPSLSSNPSNEVFETYWDLPYNFIEKKGLVEFQLESWLPADYTKYSFMKSKVNASDVIELIETAKMNTEPIWILINGKSGAYVNDTFAIEKFEYKIMQRQDYSYSLGVKQWRNPNPTVTTTTDKKIGWKSDSTGWWYVYDDNGSYYQGCWQLIDNEYYSFQPDGYCKQSDWLNDGADWYYFGDDCKMYRDKWLQYKDDWYFFGDYGEMYYGDTFEIDGKNYTFDSAGKWLE